MIGATALLLAADPLTVKGRLRRSLDKELAIKDRLPLASRERKDMDELVRLHTLELFHRQRHENSAPLVLVVLSVVGTALSAGNWIYLTKNPDVPPDPDWFNRYVLPWSPVVMLPIALVTMSSFKRRREEYVSHASAVPSRPMPTRRLPRTTAAGATIRRKRRSIENS